MGESIASLNSSGYDISSPAVPMPTAGNSIETYNIAEIEDPGEKSRI